MFTSEHWQRLRATSGSDLRFGAGLLAGGALALLVSVRVLGVWTGDQNYRTQAVNSLGPETRLLIAGSSHVFSTLNPAFIPVASMNLAAPVCSYVCVEGIVRGNLTKVPHVSAMVLEYDAVLLFYDTLRSYHGDHRALLELDPDIGSMALSRGQKYELWRDQSIEHSFLGPLFRYGKLTPREVLLRVRGEQRNADAVVAPGYANGPEVMTPAENGAARAAQHVREAVGRSELPRNEAALRRLIELARARGWRLALMRFPHHPGYWAALPADWQRELGALRERLERDFPGAFAYWDFGSLPWLSELDYRDGDHINDGASARVTAVFDQKLASWLAEPLAGGEAPSPEMRANARP